MSWTIDNQSHYDRGIADYIGYVFNLTVQHMADKLGDPPLGVKPITLRYDCTSGPIVYWPLKPDRYEIGVCVEGNWPLQIIYQAAHELCHVYIDPRMNGTFTEIICQKTAFDVLEDIGGALSQSGNQGVTEYIQSRKTTSEQIKSLSLKSIDLDWIKATVNSLEKTGTLVDREINDLIALKLKEEIDFIDKYGIIRHVRESVDIQPSTDVNDLTIVPITKVNLAVLVENIERENSLLASRLNRWK
jgi:hypothetical protein